MYVYSLEVDAFFFVEAAERLWNSDCCVTRAFIDCESQVGNSSTEFFLDLLLPVGIVSAIVDQVVVSFKSRLDLREYVLHTTASWASVNIHRERRIISADSCLDQIAQLSDLGAVFIDVVNLVVVVKCSTSFLQVFKLLSFETSGVAWPLRVELFSGHKRS